MAITKRFQNILDGSKWGPSDGPDDEPWMEYSYTDHARTLVWVCAKCGAESEHSDY